MRSCLGLLALVVQAGVTMAFMSSPVSLMPSTARPVGISRVALRQSMSTNEWQTATDSSTGATYWYNTKTGESTWEEPKQVADAPLSSGPRLGRLMPVPEGQKKNAYPGGKSGLMLMMNPIKPGVNVWNEPSLLLFFGFKISIILYAIFVGFHNQYTGDFGPFITFHDGQVDFQQASREWARLHGK